MQRTSGAMVCCPWVWILGMCTCVTASSPWAKRILHRYLLHRASRSGSHLPSDALLVRISGRIHTSNAIKARMFGYRKFLPRNRRFCTGGSSTLMCKMTGNKSNSDCRTSIPHIIGFTEKKIPHVGRFGSFRISNRQEALEWQDPAA